MKPADPSVGEPSGVWPAGATGSRSRLLPIAVQAVAVLLLFAAVGAAAGWLWFRAWTPPTGVVFEQQWYTDEAGLRATFSGTAWYVVIATSAGLVLGALCAFLLDRAELATLAAVVAGSALAAYVMFRVGLHFSPPDPDVLARTVADDTELAGELTVTGWSPYLAFPFGALTGLAVTFVGFVKRGIR